MTKEQSIQTYMAQLSISREEAEQLWQDDHDDYIGDGEQYEKKAKQTRRYETTEKKKKKRTAKKDAEKLRIINILNQALIDSGFDAIVTNPQRQIDFEKFTVTLTKHRPPKK